MKAIILNASAWMIVPVMDAFAKHLSSSMDVLQITWARYFFTVVFKMAKNNPKIRILKAYLDYADFRNTLQKIDIMPILHNNEEIKNGNPSTIYSSITHEIPMVLPQNLNYMKEVLVNKSFEIADNLDGVVTQTLKIANDYNSYLNAAKINSKLLFEIFENDPLKKNIN